MTTAKNSGQNDEGARTLLIPIYSRASVISFYFLMWELNDSIINADIIMCTNAISRWWLGVGPGFCCEVNPSSFAFPLLSLSIHLLTSQDCVILLMSLILMLDSWKKVMLPFNQHGKLGRKMFHIVATQHSKRNFFSLYDVIAHCTFGKYLAFVINALVLSKDSLVCMFHCNLYFWPSFLLFIYFFFLQLQSFSDKSGKSCNFS